MDTSVAGILDLDIDLHPYDDARRRTFRSVRGAPGDSRLWTLDWPVLARRATVPVLACLLVASRAFTLRAQDNYEIQVYEAETLAPRTTMIELHSNFTLDGRKQIDGRLWPTEDALHETLEITQGLTPWFETGFYVFTSARSGQGWQWVGDHIRPRVRAPETWHLPVGLGLSAEVGYQRPEVSVDAWTLEVRPIIDKQIGQWYVALNPALERTLRGPSVSRGVEFSPAGTVGYDASKAVNLGLEYYGSWGPMSGFDPIQAQQHQIFAVANLNLDPAWELNAGFGEGFTRSTDHLIFKMILGRRVSW